MNSKCLEIITIVPSRASLGARSLARSHGLLSTILAKTVGTLFKLRVSLYRCTALWLGTLMEVQLGIVPRNSYLCRHLATAGHLRVGAVRGSAAACAGPRVG
eukprot:591387-Rhodomonas_salina.1